MILNPIRGSQCVCVIISAATWPPRVSRVPHTAPDILPRVSTIIVSEMPAVLAELIAGANAYAAKVENGSELLRRPLPSPPPEPAPAPIVERMKIFALQNLKWQERSQTITALKYSWCSPPRHLAVLACARSLADIEGSARTISMIETFGLHHGFAHPDDCASLDALDQPAAPERLSESMIGQERIGPARTMEISVNRT